MLNLKQVEDQLKRVGCTFRFWGRPEVRELCNILIPGEIIAQAVNGRYENGFAMLCVTDHRLLLIDKKPMFLTLEDIRFDMIAEIDFNAQLVDGTIKIITPNRTLVFTSWNQGRLRNILNYTQQRVSQIRNHYVQQQFQQRDEGYSAPVVGGLALQGHAGWPTPVGGYGYAAAGPAQMPAPMNFNPYTHIPLTMRKRQRRVPKFY